MARDARDGRPVTPWFAPDGGFDPLPPDEAIQRMLDADGQHGAAIVPPAATDVYDELIADLRNAGHDVEVLDPRSARVRVDGRTGWLRAVRVDI